MKKLLLIVLSALLILLGVTSAKAATEGVLEVNLYASFAPEVKLDTIKMNVQRRFKEGEQPTSIVSGTGKYEYYLDVLKTPSAKKLVEEISSGKKVGGLDYKNFEFEDKIQTIKPTEEDILKNNFIPISDGTIPYTPGVVDVYLIFNRVKCDVTWLDYEGKEVKKETVPYNTSASTPEEKLYDRYGYEFKGFDHDIKDYVYTKTDLVIKPVYEAKTYTITFVDLDGNILDERDYKFNEEVVYLENAPEVKGMQFVKWSSDAKYVRGDKTIRPIYAPVEVDEVDIYKNMVIDDTYFTDGISNTKFNSVIDNAKLAELKYGESSLTLNLTKNKEYTITSEYLAELYPLNIKVKLDFGNLRSTFDIKELTADTKIISKAISFTKSIRNGEYTYKPVSDAFSLSVLVDGVDANLKYEVDGNFSHNNFIVYMNGETPVNITQWLDDEYDLDGENEFKFITERTLVVDSTSSNIFDNVISYVKNVPTTTLIIAGLGSLVVVLGIGLLFSRRK